MQAGRILQLGGSATVTQEFHISVTPIGEDEYLVRTERVAPGVPLAEEQVVWPMEEWLAQTRYLMSDPLLGVLQGHSPNRIGGFELPAESVEDLSELAAPAKNLLELGQRLYSALFRGTLRDSWTMAQGIAQHRGEMLRLRLGLKGNHLPRLPWEVLNAGDRDNGALHTPLATGTDIAFSRYQPNTGIMGGRPVPPLETGKPIRILMVIAVPTDQERLELHDEAIHLNQELQHARTIALEGSPLPQLELTILEQPGREQLTHALEQGRFHVLHYAGHSNLGVSGGALYLVNPRTGLTETLNGDDLAGLLVNNGIRMAVFNSCRGGHTALANPDADQRERNLAEALVSRGIPAVLAMAEKIPDDVALTLTRLFYRNLSQGYPIDLSLSRARQGLISSYGSQQFYWALPTLYLHPDFNGYLVPSDRIQHNPADRLQTRPTVAPPVNTSSHSVLEPVAQFTHPPIHSVLEPVERSTHLPSPNDEELEMVARAVMAEDDPDEMVPVPDYGVLAGSGVLDLANEPELSYSGNSELVADLIRQLTPKENPPAAILPANEWENLLPELSDPRRNLANGSPQTSAQQTTASLEPRDSLPATTHRTGSSPPPEVSPARLKESAPAAPARKINQWYILLPLAGAGLMAIAILAAQGLPSLLRARSTPEASPPAQTFNPLMGGSEQGEFGSLDTPSVAAIAIDRFNKGNRSGAEMAVKALLDRGAVAAAREALNAVSPDDISEPSINYLQGRMQWQFVQQGIEDFSVDDARRSWENAFKDNQDSVDYPMALGFAQYTEGNSAAAIQTWCKIVTSTLGSQGGEPVAETVPGSCFMPPQTLSNPAVLRAYAGIALALQQASLDPTFAGDPKKLSDRAARIYQIVNRNDPYSFQPNALNGNWLWTQQAIRDWVALGRQS